MSEPHPTRVPPWVYITGEAPPAGRARWSTLGDSLAASFAPFLARRLRLIRVRRRHRFRLARGG